MLESVLANDVVFWGIVCGSAFVSILLLLKQENAYLRARLRRRIKRGNLNANWDFGRRAYLGRGSGRSK